MRRIKLRSVRSTAWSLLAGFGLMLALTALVCSTSTTTEGLRDTPATTTSCGTAFGVWLGQIPFVLLAVLAIASEYSTGMIRTTFAANPRRWATVTSKSSARFVLLDGAPRLGGLVRAGPVAPAGNGFNYQGGYDPVTLSDGPALRAVVGTALYLTALALLALGIAAIVRHTATAISIVLGVVFVPIIAVGVLRRRRATSSRSSRRPRARRAADRRAAGRHPDRPMDGPRCRFRLCARVAAVAPWLVRATPSSRATRPGRSRARRRAPAKRGSSPSPPRPPRGSRPRRDPDGPADSEHDLRDPPPGWKVTVALVFSCLVAPASASPCERAIETHAAWAAAISSSGLVRPAGSPPARPT